MLSDSAQNKEELFAANHAEMLGQDLESKVITDLADWLGGLRSSDYTPNPNEDVKMYIETFDLDGFLAAGNIEIEDVLAEMWIKDFKHSGETSANIAAFLIENNHCDELMIDDLRAIAEANNKGLENKAPSM